MNDMYKNCIPVEQRHHLKTYLKLFFDIIADHFTKCLNILVINKFVAINSSCLMKPETCQVYRSLKTVEGAVQNTL